MNIDGLNVQYRAADQDAARKLVDRIGILHEFRLAMVAIDDQRRAVAAADQIHGLLDTVNAEQLRAAVILLTTPELRPAIPVVVGPTSAPAGPANPSTEKVGGLAAPAPPALRQVLDLVRIYGDARAAHARRFVEQGTVERAFRDVEVAAESLAAGVLAAEILRASQDGAL